MKNDTGKCKSNLVCIHRAPANHATFQVLSLFRVEARLRNKTQRRDKCNQLVCPKLETVSYSCLPNLLDYTVIVFNIELMLNKYFQLV